MKTLLIRFFVRKVSLLHTSQLTLCMATLLCGAALVACSGQESNLQNRHNGTAHTAAEVGVARFKAEDGQTMQASYREDNTVVLTLANGSIKVLPQVLSASGSRYATATEEWWEHQGKASYSENDAVVFTGQLIR